MNLRVALVGGAVLPLDLEKEVLLSRSERRSTAAASFSTMRATFDLRLRSRRETNCELLLLARYWRFAARDASRLRMAR